MVSPIGSAAIRSAGAERRARSCLPPDEEKLAPPSATDLNLERGAERGENRGRPAEPRLVRLAFELDHGAQGVEPPRQLSSEPIRDDAVHQAKKRRSPGLDDDEPAARAEHAADLADGPFEIHGQLQQVVQSSLHDRDVSRFIRERQSTAVPDEEIASSPGPSNERRRKVHSESARKPELGERAQSVSTTAEELEHSDVAWPPGGAEALEPADELSGLPLRSFEAQVGGLPGTRARIQRGALGWGHRGGLHFGETPAKKWSEPPKSHLAGPRKSPRSFSQELTFSPSAANCSIQVWRRQ